MSLEGRKFWLVGIGGSGLSAYALVARGWGAEVAGWDRKETPYLAPGARGRDSGDRVGRAARAAGRASTRSCRPPTPDEWRGKPRAELLAELAAQAPTIVVSGAHGKTTTAAMIAFVLDRLGLDPAFAIGGEVPQLGANARAGSGWFVVEGDESDRTVASLPARIAVITNVDLDHHTTFGSQAEVAELYAEWLAGLPDVQVVRGDTLEPVDLPLAVPGEHNRRNAAAALAALELAGVARADAEAAIVEFRGAGRRLEPRGEAGGVQVLDDYAHHPAELAATIAAARELSDGRLVVLFQPHLFSRTLLSGPRLRRRARRRRRGVRHGHLRRAGGPDPRRDREAHRRTAVRAQAGHAGGLGADAGRGRGSSSRRRRGRAGSSSPPAPETWTPPFRRILDGSAADETPREEGVALSRYTTLGTGGPARFFAAPSTEDELVELLAWARDEGLAAAPVGLGSNLLVADEGFPGLALKLSGELAAAHARGRAAARGRRGRRSRSACIGHATPVSAASSSRARSRGRSAAPCG